MPVEFLGIGGTNDGSEIGPRSGVSFDKEYTLRLARAHEDHGWDRVLFAYGSGSPDPAQVAAFVASRTEKLQILLAHRPNLSIPTYAAKTFATLDHISDGRFTVHFITGGNDHEQQREGDFLTKDGRYDRTQEYIQIVKPAWTSREPFDHEGKHYKLYDIGVEILSARGYDIFGDAIDFGRFVIPIVREEVAKRDAERVAILEKAKEPHAVG